MSKPRWQELCAQAAVEQDPKKLLRLVTEINQLLDHPNPEKSVDARRSSASSSEENRQFQGGK